MEQMSFLMQQNIAERGFATARESLAQKEIGRLYGKFEVISYKGYDACKVRCTECGAERRKGVAISKLRNGIYPECNCGKPRYGDPKWIGLRSGHLTVERHEGRYFICKCDCGRERAFLDSYFANNRYRDCGNPECEFIEEQKKRSLGAKIRGEAYEAIAKAIIESGGYKTKLVAKTGDFGVDIIATDNNGIEIAVQCKSNMKDTTGVDAVQQVYAGGRYYGLERFAVISHSGYSKNAILMAKRLGVYLSDGRSFVYPDDIGKYAKDLVPTYNAAKHPKAQKLYEMNGEKKTLANWAFEYGTHEAYVRKGLKKGLSLENALKYKPRTKVHTYEVNGFIGTLSELCDRFGVVKYPCALYRITNGWSPEDAVLTPKMKNGGRPRKLKYSQV